MLASRLTSWALAAALVLSLPNVASGTTVVRQSFESLTDQSDVIVRGVVERVELRAPADSPPFRLAYVRVAESAAGAPPEVVPVRIPGGVTANGLACTVAGTPSLAAGDELVLFLTRVPDSATALPTVAPPARERGAGGVPAGGDQPRAQWQPIALSLGTWRVVEAAGVKSVVPDAGARGLYQQGPAGGTPLTAGTSVDDLFRRIRERRAKGTP